MRAVCFDSLGTIAVQPDAHPVEGEEGDDVLYIQFEAAEVLPEGWDKVRVERLLEEIHGMIVRLLNGDDIT